MYNQTFDNCWIKLKNRKRIYFLAAMGLIALLLLVPAIGFIFYAHNPLMAAVMLVLFFGLIGFSIWYSSIRTQKQKVNKVLVKNGCDPSVFWDDVNDGQLHEVKEGQLFVGRQYASMLYQNSLCYYARIGEGVTITPNYNSGRIWFKYDTHTYCWDLALQPKQIIRDIAALLGVAGTALNDASTLYIDLCESFFHAAADVMIRDARPYFAYEAEQKANELDSNLRSTKYASRLDLAKKYAKRCPEKEDETMGFCELMNCADVMAWTYNKVNPKAAIGFMECLFQTVQKDPDITDVDLMTEFVYKQHVLTDVAGLKRLQAIPEKAKTDADLKVRAFIAEYAKIRQEKGYDKFEEGK